MYRPSYKNSGNQGIGFLDKMVDQASRTYDKLILDDLRFIIICYVKFCMRHTSIMDGRHGIIFEPPRGKTNNVVSEQVRHKRTCTSIEDGQKLEISDLRRRGSVLSM